MNRITRIALSVAACSTLLVGTGCSLTTADGPAEASQAPSSPAETQAATKAPTPAQPSEEPTEEASDEPTDAPSDEPTDESESPAPTTAELSEDLDRATLLAAVETEDNCASGKVLVDRTGVVVAVTADCDEVEITGNGSIVVGQGIGKLTVAGTGSAVLATTIDAVSITKDGNGSVVNWESGSPTVADASIGSVAVAAGA
ncbi:hypothetical protein [Tessaracoccus aquimaris]|uniref:hypothetical protein n=1 Tax=Tessaracoccus aquimaris TaxID=1332264 RepID=UPI0011AB76C1|nr:hypothetical protein [Tessaracoccus aquimaris]